ncbi:gypsy retrotransposon integrase-like protein 1 isoform X2 [Alligator sinensis]|uniref:Gypsy retrotransposon integrase-like protein 1 n=1 Tax=Alligator sinensis TaxID=38654 RepID=A0A3Q0GHF6_ALLSI|nr:gypsy retrotransposon integrase-like protein 1 isoform X2 [Alligator sinensis]
MVRSGKNGGLHLKQISHYKRTGEYHPTTLSSERSGIRRAAKKFVFKENKLFYVGKDRKQMRLVIFSDEEKKKVLEKCHANTAGTHHGISRTLTLVESSYYWTSVTNDVKQWVYACQLCQVAKNTAVTSPILHPIKAEEPWTAVTIDLMGPFDATSRSHVYVIIITDLFTKWLVVLPLADISAAEIAKAVVSVFFLYGPPQKMAIDQEEELVDQELAPNTPYFQMFNRKPYISEISNIPQEVEEDNKCMFAKILEAVKQTNQILEERKATDCQTVKNAQDEQQTGNKFIIKRKPKQLNPLHLKVGHEVLRQKKNWWKDGRFQSEWVGPCIIDYITDNGCAILRDNTGSRLKRPIKMSHLKPYIRGSSDQDEHYFLQGAIVVDHDYVGLSERSCGLVCQDTITKGEGNTFTTNDELPPPDKALELSTCKSQQKSQKSDLPVFMEDHNIPPANVNSEQWPPTCWTLQTKIEDT